MKNKVKYCDPNCKHLSITEKMQDKIPCGDKYPHICVKYKKRVFHYDYHPNLVMVQECSSEKKSIIEKICIYLKNIFKKRN